MVYLIPGAAITNWVFKIRVIYSPTKLLHPCHPWGRHSECLWLSPFKLCFPSGQEARNPKSGFWPVGRATFSVKALCENLSNVFLVVSGIANNCWLATNFLARRHITHVSTSVFICHSPCLSSSLYLLLSSFKDTSHHVRLRDHPTPVWHHLHSIHNNFISKQGHVFEVLRTWIWGSGYSPTQYTQ